MSSFEFSVLLCASPKYKTYFKSNFHQRCITKHFLKNNNSQKGIIENFIELFNTPKN
jgi:hypothetical protein